MAYQNLDDYPGMTESMSINSAKSDAEKALNENIELRVKLIKLEKELKSIKNILKKNKLL